jgi:catechol 2,3-dioxygenase-like lactoylglutathione lyase family enzyme
MTLNAMEHLLVLTDDLDSTLAFYRDVLGLDDGARPPLPFPGHWLYAGPAPCVHIADRAAYTAHARTIGLDPSPERTGSGVIDHIAFRATDHDAIVERLERHGVEAVRNTVEGAGIRQLFVRDPNGVTIEINVLPQ